MPDAVERLRDQRRLPRGRSVFDPARAVAPAVAGTIDQNDASRPREPVAEREPEVAEISAGAMDQHDRPARIGCVRGAFTSASGWRQIEDVKPAAVDFDETAGGRMGRLDAPRSSA